ncbi:MAG: glycosyltransferase [Caldilineaceae bacterium]|nr:glycosyltransferase [Caldilineaceae bacterium]
MRIALFSDVYKPVINGVVNHVSLLKRYFERWGEQVWLFVPGQPESVDDEANVIRLPGVPIADTGYHLSVALDRRARNILKQADIIHVHHPFLSGSFGLNAARRYDLPLVFTNHTRYDLYVQQYLPLIPEALSDTALQAFFHLFSQRCSAFIAPSQGIAEVMREEWGVQGRVAVIPNGVELDDFHSAVSTQSRQALGIAPDALVGVFVGRMSGEKAVDRLLRIFAVLAQEQPRLHLLLIGGGPELADYQLLAQQLGVAACVTFAGALPYQQIPGYLKLADFFVSASVSEVHPLTFIEAAAMGLPAVGIDSPGVTDMIVDGKTGFVAADSDLSFGLRVLRLAQDENLRAQMGQAAQEQSHAYAAHTNAREVLNLYQSLMR